MLRVILGRADFIKKEQINTDLVGCDRHGVCRHDVGCRHYVYVCILVKWGKT
jgi:hypothetical protein